MAQIPWNKGRKMSPESIIKMKAHVFTEEHRQHLSESHMGQSPVNAWGKGHVPWNKGKLHSEQTRKKISEANRGKYFRAGYVPSMETRAKLSAALFGDKSPAWRGGIGGKPYTIGFTKSLKSQIKERDGFTCFICGGGKNGKQLVIHHVDYSKNNHKPENLITLCNSCHSMTNHRREQWISYFGTLTGEKHE